jgi:SAM-dependent methyltransferase
VRKFFATTRRERRTAGSGPAAGRLEFLRTQDLLRRLLPPAPLDIADVGGGSGVHAEWLARDGHRVELVDPVPLHVEQAATLPGVRARLGDARALPLPDAGADAVLLLGPLYHLTARRERVRALAEAVRVVCPGGLVAAATLNRFSALHDQLRKGEYFAPAEREFIDSVSDSGQHLRPGGGFCAYLHEPAEVPGEFEDAGLAVRGQYGVEGAAWLMPGVTGWTEDGERRSAVLAALRRTESAPSLLGVSAHLLTVGSV